MHTPDPLKLAREALTKIVNMSINAGSARASVRVAREALAALSAAPAGEPVAQWVDINERVPDKGTDCLIWSQEPWEKSPSLKQDRWDEIHEAPLSFSSATVYVGDGWVDDHTCVTHWMKAPPGPGIAAPAPAEPAVPPDWRAHVEQRMRAWRQQHMNRSGDRLALTDFMSEPAIDDLIDYVCDQWAEPAAPTAPKE